MESYKQNWLETLNSVSGFGASEFFNRYARSLHSDLDDKVVFCAMHLLLTLFCRDSDNSCLNTVSSLEGDLANLFF